jgi:two-component system sensor histidine kinase EvgS
MFESGTTERPKRILVIDDEPTVARTLRLVLNHLGHEVEIVHDAETALRVFAPGKFDLVTTDFKLPGMNGLELARNLKALDHSQPILLISAYAQPGRWKAQQLQNVDGVLCKPFALVELNHAITRALLLFAPVPHP